MSRQHNQTNTYPNMNGNGLSMGQVLSGFWSRKWYVLFFMVIVVAATYFTISNLKPIYSAESKILVEGHDPDTSRFSVNNQSSPADALKVSSEAQILLSQDLASKLINKLNLTQYSEYNGSGKKSLFGDKKKSGKATNIHDIAREAYFENLTVYPVAETRVLVVEFKSDNPKRAANLANELSKAYVESTRQTPFDKNTQTNSFLVKEIKKLKSEILTAEKSMENFRARNGLIEGNNGTLYAQELAELNRQIAEVSAVRAEASAKAASARRLLGGNQSIDVAADVINSNLIQRLREQQIKLRRKITELSTTYLPAHPQMIQLNNQLQNLDRLVSFEVTKIAASLTDQAKVAAARENTLRAKLNRLKTKAVAQGQSTAKLKSMERNIQSKRNLLNTYLTKQTDTLSRRDLSNVPYGARIISTALPASKPIFPKKGPIMFLSFVSALVLAFVVSFLTDVSRSGPVMAQSHIIQNNQPQVTASPAQAEAPPPLQTTGSIGRAGVASTSRLFASRSIDTARMSTFKLSISENTDISSLYAENSQLQSEIVTLGTHAHQTAQQLGTKFILVTSEQKFPQKSFISAGLGRFFASHGLKTIIVDADVLSPTISHLMGVQPGPGLSEVLIGAYPFSEAVIKDRNTGVSIMPAGSRGTQAYSQLKTQSTSLVMRSLAMVYDLIIINAPSLSENSHIQNLTSNPPYVCLAAGGNTVSKQQISQLNQQILSAGAGHISQINCSAKSGGLLSGIFKSRAA